MDFTSTSQPSQLLASPSCKCVRFARFPWKISKTQEKLYQIIINQPSLNFSSERLCCFPTKRNEGVGSRLPVVRCRCPNQVGMWPSENKSVSSEMILVPPPGWRSCRRNTKWLSEVWSHWRSDKKMTKTSNKDPSDPSQASSPHSSPLDTIYSSLFSSVMFLFSLFPFEMLQL